MELPELIEACRKLQAELESRNYGPRAEAIRQMLVARASGTESLQTVRFVLQRILEGKPEMDVQMRAKVSRLIQKIDESLSI